MSASIKRITKNWLITQLKGEITGQRYTPSTVFVGHKLGLGFIYHQANLSSEETLRVKYSFEIYAFEHDILKQHYHCDNDLFANNALVNDCERQGQGLSYCRVNAHSQNRIIDKGIRHLQ